jgi:hypothetical protein
LLPALLSCVGALARPQAASAQNGNSSQAAAVSGVSAGDAISLQDYRKHLQALDTVVMACRKLRTAQACDPAQVGADDKVTWHVGGVPVEREVEYDWLRLLLQSVGHKDKPMPGPALGVGVHGIKRAPVNMDELLAEAQQRLESDSQHAGETEPQAQDSSAERKSLNAILARREYKGTSEVSRQERFDEWLENKLANILEELIGIGARAPWLGYVLEGLLLGVLATALIWALIRLERRSRVRLTPEFVPVSGAPSAREWQLWLRDAQAMAAQTRWREAIHFLYWASISRLESMRLWPADRARTPREYLRLLAGTDPRRTSLTALTRSFERTWYGGREAYSSDFQAALEIAAALGVE